MDSLKSRSIIQTAFALNYYPRKHIDAPTLNLLRQSIPVGDNKSDLLNPLINLLDGYLGITGQSITYLSLFKNTANELFSGFIGALLCETFVATSRSTRDNYVRTILKTLKAISFNIPNLTSEIDQDTALILWRGMRIDPLQREYYQGWRVESKTGRKAYTLNLHGCGITLGQRLHEHFTKLRMTLLNVMKGRARVILFRF